MSYPVRAARQRIEDEHAAVVAGIDHCADQVAAPWDTARTTDPSRVADSLGSALETTGLLERLTVVLADAVDATGHDLQARPVPGPPYVVVTSRGPVLRATIEPGRLVIRFDVFEVVRDPGPAYHRLDGIAVDVALE
ncbi:hypothetical protein ACFO5R_16595 [Halosolutus amylolyticus]|uniref:DUF7988 domain-containing protein n=1 Tax=Halosolutus amylolyticus TaxID=2932267 RepID=A0ABD5PSW5_9EURY|nr:hypothetical protein [Halosolutus amylolyticus]